MMKIKGNKQMLTLNQTNLKLSSVGAMPLLCNAEVASASMTMTPPACCKIGKEQGDKINENEH